MVSRKKSKRSGTLGQQKYLIVRVVDEVHLDIDDEPEVDEEVDDEMDDEDDHEEGDIDEDLEDEEE